MEIKWLTRDEESDFSEKDIAKFEKYAKITLPQKYKELLIKNKAECPEDDLCFMVSDEERVLDSFLSYFRDEDDDVDDIEMYFEYKTIKHELKDKFGLFNKFKLIPFANDPGGNVICFDYSNKSDVPSVVFYDTEKAYEDGNYHGEFVAGSFEEFLNIVYVPED